MPDAKREFSQVQLRKRQSIPEQPVLALFGGEATTTPQPGASYE